MPTRQLINRLESVTDWSKIPKKDKSGKMLWIYFRDGRKYNRAWFIAYQDEEDNVLLRFPNSAFFKKFKGKDKIYVDPELLYKKDMKRIVKGWKPTENESKEKSKKKVVKSKKKGGKILLKF